MALIVCPECGKNFSDRAAACPECGCPTSEIITQVQPEELLTEAQEPIAAAEAPTIETDEEPTVAETPNSKKKLIILGAIAVAVIILAFAIFHKSKFEKVKDECVQIAGMVSGSGDYFTIDTYPDVYEDMDPTVASLLLPGAQENALEAIRYANSELGFNGSVYSKMMETSALMGRQTEENDKYKVSWTYHPDDGLEVTYEKK